MNSEAQQKISQSKKLSDFMQICVLGQGNYGKVSDYNYKILKPENVLIDIHGYIRLADFGLSYLEFDEISLAKSICGTPEYMAPEIIKKQGYNQQVDYWSLGGILFEMITGIPPFDYRLIYRQDQKFEKIYDRILQSDLPMPRLLSTFGKDLLNKLMQKVPSKRLGYNGIQEIKDHPWFSAVDWDLLGKKKYKAPFIPKLQDEFDVNNFEIAFTSQDVQISDDEDDQYIEEYKHFEDFSYCLDDLQEQNIKNTHQQISTIGQQQNILNQQDNDSIKLPNRCIINFDFEKIDLEEKKIDLQNQNGLNNILNNNNNNNGQNNTQKQSLFKINEETIPKQQINQDKFQNEGNIIENLKQQARPMQKTEIHGLQKIHEQQQVEEEKRQFQLNSSQKKSDRIKQKLKELRQVIDNNEADYEQEQFITLDQNNLNHDFKSKTLSQIYNSTQKNQKDLENQNKNISSDFQNQYYKNPNLEQNSSLNQMSEDIQKKNALKIIGTPSKLQNFQEIYQKLSQKKSNQKEKKTEKTLEQPQLTNYFNKEGNQSQQQQKQFQWRDQQDKVQNIHRYVKEKVQNQEINVYEAKYILDELESEYQLDQCTFSPEKSIQMEKSFNLELSKISRKNFQSHLNSPENRRQQFQNNFSQFRSLSNNQSPNKLQNISKIQVSNKSPSTQNILAKQMPQNNYSLEKQNQNNSIKNQNFVQINSNSNAKINKVTQNNYKSKKQNKEQGNYFQDQLQNLQNVLNQSQKKQQTQNVKEQGFSFNTPKKFEQQSSFFQSNKSQKEKSKLDFLNDVISKSQNKNQSPLYNYQLRNNKSASRLIQIQAQQNDQIQAQSRQQSPQQYLNINKQKSYEKLEKPLLNFIHQPDKQKLQNIIMEAQKIADNIKNKFGSVTKLEQKQLQNAQNQETKQKNQNILKQQFSDINSNNKQNKWLQQEKCQNFINKDPKNFTFSPNRDQDNSIISNNNNNYNIIRNVKENENSDQKQVYFNNLSQNISPIKNNESLLQTQDLKQNQNSLITFTSAKKKKNQTNYNIQNQNSNLKQNQSHQKIHEKLYQDSIIRKSKRQLEKLDQLKKQEKNQQKQFSHSPKISDNSYDIVKNLVQQGKRSSKSPNYLQQQQKQKLKCSFRSHNCSPLRNNQQNNFQNQEQQILNGNYLNDGIQYQNQKDYYKYIVSDEKVEQDIQKCQNQKKLEKKFLEFVDQKMKDQKLAEKVMEIKNQYFEKLDKQLQNSDFKNSLIQKPNSELKSKLNSKINSLQQTGHQIELPHKFDTVFNQLQEIEYKLQRLDQQNQDLQQQYFQNGNKVQKKSKIDLIYQNLSEKMLNQNLEKLQYKAQLDQIYSQKIQNKFFDKNKKTNNQFDQQNGYLKQNDHEQQQHFQ
ncbi:Protein kinase-like domain [Pseudocohnilembus persalinus]|uniref:Protein kinase-like domain n=1 Tax=Pseudocohnilembus persalinus TaxID=266149 RepID=A0A0V0QB78_PSEPJ|nr:Protein kinase-like domain [Pseudocohnilembus persalinus]|eukprot:KRW99442.1 Protein kinase-like domain [Pseudocohnilembus persalinus]